MEVSKKMHETKPCHPRELICINVEKVYDWLVKDMSFEFFASSPITFPQLPTTLLSGPITGAKVTCKVMPSATNPVVIMNRENRNFTIDCKKVCLQQLTIQKNFSVIIYITLPNGMTYAGDPIEISRCEHVVMCAPDGTDIDVTYTDLECFVCSTGDLTYNQLTQEVTFSNLSISVAVCQSIQSTFPVTVEFLADYCEPRSDISLSCSPAARPGSCSVVYP